MLYKSNIIVGSNASCLFFVGSAIHSCHFSLWLRLSDSTFSVSLTPILHHLPPVSSCSSSNGKAARRRLLTFHLYTSLSLSLPVSFSFLNQEKVAWARPGVCQKMTLPVWVPAPGLWLAAWRRPCSWLSTPYRSARRGGGGGTLLTRPI